MTATPLPSAPPRPQLAVRVGVTGHRAHRLDPAREPAIQSALADVFAAIRAAAEQALAQARWAYRGDAPALRLISPLADGADSLAWRAARDEGFTLQAPLPFPVARYRDDFAPEGRDDFDAALSRAERVRVLDPGDDDDDAYLAAGLETLHQSDLLIAVWDKAPARGVGGTGMIVAEALRRGLPVVRVDPAGATPPEVLAGDDAPSAPLLELDAVMARLFAPPERDDRTSAELFFAERQKRGNHGAFFHLFEAALTGRKPRHLRPRLPAYDTAAAARNAETRDALGPDNAEAADVLAAALTPRETWADQLAVYYAAAYRTSYTINYLLAAAAAVFLALLDLVLGYGKPIWVSIEVVVIFFILTLTLAGRRGRWHEKWIDYRQVAEQLRQMRFVFLCGGEMPEGGDVRLFAETDAAERTWVQWYVKATERELGLAPVRADHGYADTVRAYFASAELDQQIGYHSRNYDRMARMERALHRTGYVFFGLTLAACLAYLAFSAAAAFEGARDLQAASAQWITMATALFPALGAAMLAIRSQGEFGSAGERSHAMAQRLGEIRQRLATHPDGALGAAELRAYVDATIETMVMEVADWRFVFRGKPLSLPA